MQETESRKHAYGGANKEQQSLDTAAAIATDTGASESGTPRMLDSTPGPATSPCVSAQRLPSLAEMISGADERLLRRPASAAQLQLLASAIERVLSLNKKHLFTLQLSRRRSGDSLSRAPDMDAPLVDRSGRLPPALVTPYDGTAAPPYTFEAYLTRIAKYTNVPMVYYLLAFVYMDRIAATPRSVFKQRFSRAMPLAPGSRSRRLDVSLDWWEDRLYLTQLNVHRMFLACLVVAVKYWSDHFYNNRVYGKVGGVRAEEMMSLELATLIWLDFRLGVEENDFLAAPLPLPEELTQDAGRGSLLASLSYLLKPTQLLPAMLCPTLIAQLHESLAASAPYHLVSPATLVLLDVHRRSRRCNSSSNNPSEDTDMSDQPKPILCASHHCHSPPRHVPTTVPPPLPQFSPDASTGLVLRPAGTNASSSSSLTAATPSTATPSPSSSSTSLLAAAAAAPDVVCVPWPEIVNNQMPFHALVGLLSDRIFT